MPGSDVRFYADLSDMEALLCRFESIGSFVYAEKLSDLNRPLIVLTDAMMLIRYLRTRDLQAAGIFLIMESAIKINSESMVMSDGSGVKIVVDSLLNPDATFIILGGVFDEIIVATSINSMCETEAAKRTFEALKKLIVKGSRYANGFYVFPGADKKLKSGWRLTQSPGYSPALNLKPDSG